MDVVARLREQHVDIAIDLVGHTGAQRTEIFARGVAPIQVNYLGFPGSMGMPQMDYILADENLVLPEHRADFAEEVVCLPECFQANDNRRRIDEWPLTRTEAGLPQDGFVWCSFHGSYKLNPVVFDIWVRLVREVPGSVLWLLGGNPRLESNLRREAAARGLDPSRLVFASTLPYAKHLARLRLADLCLDTLPFNGGTTSSDALWAGLPILTCAGQELRGTYDRQPFAHARLVRSGDEFAVGLRTGGVAVGARSGTSRVAASTFETATAVESFVRHSGILQAS